MLKIIHLYKIEVYFFSLLSLLFGVIFFNESFFNSYLAPVLSIINIITGTLLISKKNKLYYLWLLVFSIALFTTLFELFFASFKTIRLLKFLTYFLFYIIVTYQLVLKIWNSKKVHKKIILALMSGYISLGFIAFFLFMSIELTSSNSFSGLAGINHFTHSKIDELLYFSYVSLMTIGYGDIVPKTTIAQKATILVGLLGQFYMVILTAIIVGKYLNQQQKTLE